MMNKDKSIVFTYIILLVLSFQFVSSSSSIDSFGNIVSNANGTFDWVFGKVSWSNIQNSPMNLSQFSDNLGDRGYSFLSNFTDDIGVLTSESDPIFLSENLTLWNGINNIFIGNKTFNNSITISENLTLGGIFNLNGLIFPSTDGAVGQVLATDGSGNLYFTNSSNTLHNDLGGLQGGTTDEYFHLTNNEYSIFQGNVSSWVTNMVSNLQNYYLKTEVYNKTQVDTNLTSLDNKLTSVNESAVHTTDNENIDGVKTFNSYPKFGGAGFPTDPTEFTTKDYVDANRLNNSIQQSVLNFTTSTPPISPTIGDRYRVYPAGTGAWGGLDNELVTWNGTVWVSDGTPETGWAVFSVAEAQSYLYQDGVLDRWVLTGTTQTYTASYPLQKNVDNFELLWGSGLDVVANTLTLNISDTFNLSGGKLNIAPSGITNSQLAGNIPDSKLSTITTTDKVSWNSVNKTGSSISDLADVDTTGAIANDCLVFDGNNWVDSECASGSGGSGNGTTMTEISILAQPSSALAWTNMPLAETQFLNSVIYRRYADLSSVTQARLVVYNSVAGATNSKLYAQYSLDGGTSWLNLSSDNTGTIPLNVVSLKNTSWFTINIGAKSQNTLLRVVGQGGDGVIDPAFRQLHLQFTSPIGGSVNVTYTNLTNIITQTINYTTTNYTYQGMDMVSYTGVTWTNMPLALTELNAGSRLRIPALSIEQWRGLIHMSTSCQTTGFVYYQYSIDEGVSWTNLSSTNQKISCNATGGTSLPRQTNWEDVPNNAKSDNLLVRLVGYGGDGAVDPLFRQIRLQFKTPMIGTNDSSGSSTPTDTNWANSSTMTYLINNQSGVAIGTDAIPFFNIANFNVRARIKSSSRTSLLQFSPNGTQGESFIGNSDGDTLIATEKDKSLIVASVNSSNPSDFVNVAFFNRGFGLLMYGSQPINLGYSSAGFGRAGSLTFYNASGSAIVKIDTALNQTTFGNSGEGHNVVVYGNITSNGIYKGLKTNLTGAGNSYACLDLNGNLYRSDSACA